MNAASVRLDVRRERRRELVPVEEEEPVLRRQDGRDRARREAGQR